MPIDVQCKSCKARYRVKEEFAGRTVRCKHCGDRFRVPYRASVVTLEDDVAEEAAPPLNPPVPLEREPETPHEPVEIAASGRTFNEYAGVKKSETRRRRENAKEIATEPYLPPIVAELWMPLAIALFGYGVAIYLAVTKMLASHGPVAGLILIGAFVTLHLALIIPMVMRTLEGAANTVDFELPNSIWLQTAAALALP